MPRFIFPGLLCAGLAGVLAASFVRADCPVKANVGFQFNVKFGGSNANCVNGCQKVPWYLYFPVDPCMVSPMGQIVQPNLGMQPSRFPNWPPCFPPPDAGQCGPPGCPNPGMPPQACPPWQMQPYEPGGMPAQPVSYGGMNGAHPQTGTIILTGSTNSYAPGWPPYPAYPVSWQPGYYYYGR